ncbi:hypothetical protein [Mesorhizobium marinum]|uniref:hypothetical protein n=1 Tax=Mesorhizobium marinum TaxID=3228790 RepID=UPI0034660AF8
MLRNPGKRRSFACRWLQSELPELIGPEVRQVISDQRTGREVNRLPTAQDGIGDLWRQEGERQDTADISAMHAQISRDIRDGLT